MPLKSYFTKQDLLDYSGGVSASAAREILRKSSPSIAGTFDVFLSHSIRDAGVILGLRKLLERQGMRVYVDWIEDVQLDRSKVSATTAERLRRRMKQSASLIYATSRAAQKSRWMPWELGYFDGIKGGNRVSILPIEDGGGGPFSGEEYLGLYKVIEKSSSAGSMQARVVHPTQGTSESLRSFADVPYLFENKARR